MIFIQVELSFHLFYSSHYKKAEGRGGEGRGGKGRGGEGRGGEGRGGEGRGGEGRRVLTKVDMLKLFNIIQ